LPERVVKGKTLDAVMHLLLRAVHKGKREFSGKK